MKDCASIPWSRDCGILTTIKRSTWPKKFWSSNWGAWRGRWANLSTASWYWIQYINKSILIRSYWVYMLTLTNDISRLSVWSETSSRACIISPPSTWHARPYWTKGNVGGISFRMIETDVSRRVAKVAVRVVQRGFERVFASCIGGVRTYNGSRLLKSVTGLYKYILWKAHIKVA